MTYWQIVDITTRLHVVLELSLLSASMEIRVGGKYILKSKIGSGSFGEIYLGTDVVSQKNYAMKLKETNVQDCQLPYENEVYKKIRGGTGFPNIEWFGLEGDFYVMVMELLGPSLEDCFIYRNRRFTVKTVLLLADQMISRLQHVHSKGLVHRDIKPDNFLMGFGPTQNMVYLIDFGLAKRYKTSKNVHCAYRTGFNLTGTARYASTNTHMGIEASRRDDLEALGYVFIYFLKGKLPWQGLPATSKEEKYEMIKNLKISTTLDSLCEDLPSEFQTYLEEARSLKFDAEPDYDGMRQRFRNAYEHGKYVDRLFDWTQEGRLNSWYESRFK